MQENKDRCWEVSDSLTDLIKQAEECTQFLEENSVGYYYMGMLDTLRQINKSGNLVVPPSYRFKKKPKR